MFKRIAVLLSLALLPLTAGAATFIIPAAGTGPGANGSQWSTELVIHNASSLLADIQLKYHDSTGTSPVRAFVVGARTTVMSPDVVRNIFGKASGTGAVEIDVDDALASRVAITSRTFNTAPVNFGDAHLAQLGQDVPAINTDDAPGVGDLSVLAGPAFSSDARFNFGAYAVSDAAISWELVRKDGTIAASKEVSYDAGTQFQYNNGISTLFGATPNDADVVYATVTKGKAIVYGSFINSATGDPTYVPGIHIRADSHIVFAVDVNEDGTADLKDANADGVLDEPVNLYTIGFPNYFRVVFPGQNLSDVKVELADPAPDVLLLDDKGSIEWAPSSTVRGTTLTLRLKVTVGGVTEIISIPGRVN